MRFGLTKKKAINDISVTRTENSSRLGLRPISALTNDSNPLKSDCDEAPMSSVSYSLHDEDEYMNRGSRLLLGQLPPSSKSSPRTDVTDVEIQSTTSELNEIISDLLLKQGKDMICKVVAHRAVIIESIIWLGRHIPRCVLAQLVDEVNLKSHHRYGYWREYDQFSKGQGGKENKFANGTIISNSRQKMHVSLRNNLILLPYSSSMGLGQMMLPHVETYQCALLFIDMSGFTSLANSLDVESLSKEINDYFEMIVDTVISHGGDILKFAGDAIFSEWRVISETSQTSSSSRSSDDTSMAMTIADCILTAATCAAKVVAECSDYPVSSPNGGQVGGQRPKFLNVHCGLGVGELTSVHVGNCHSRREFLVVGEPINQVSEAEDVASLGEVVASPEALILLRNTCNFYSATREEEPWIIASKKEQCFIPKQQKQLKVQTVTPIDNMESVFQGMHTEALEHLQRNIAFYVHPIIVESEMTLNSFTRGGQETQERHRAEAELRSVFTMFVMPLISTKLSDDEVENMKLFQLLNDIMNKVTEVLERFTGHLRQFIVDDKGVVLIATFGLRSTTTNMIAERALPATKLLHATLKNDLGVENQIGCTFGKAYCGVVGGILRHEFAVLGPSVNFAARLMSQPNHPGILVDNEVRIKAGDVTNFRPLNAVKARGYPLLVPIFEPMTAKKRRWGAVDPHFVGRKKEVDFVCNLAMQMVSSNGPAKMFFLEGDSGSGKSSVLVKTIAAVSKALSEKNVVVTRNISSEGDSMFPFSLFRSVFRSILLDLQVQDDDSCHSDGSSHDAKSLFDYSDRLSLSNASGISDYSSMVDRFSYLCRQLGAPKVFWEIVGHHLLGHSKQTIEGISNDKALVLDEIISFMAKAFSMCTSHSDLIVFAIDDIHNVDEMSMKVVQRLYETCENLLIFCGSRPLSSYKLSIDNDFWAALTGKHKKEKRFFFSELGPLEEKDVREMTSKYLDCEVVESDELLCKDIFVHSGGMPYFASEILTDIKRKKLCGLLANGKIGWCRTIDGNESNGSSLTFSSLDELIKQRIDGLDDGVRQILNIAAVLGTTFDLGEILRVYVQMFSIPTSDRYSAAEKVCNILDLALKERILEESLDNFEFMYEERDLDLQPYPDEKKLEFVGLRYAENKQYSFYHDKWKSNLLALLLQSRKRDIHRSAAEAYLFSEEKHDYHSKIQLFRHWKECGDTMKAAMLSLEIGNSFSSVGLNEERIRIYDDALDMWRPDQQDMIIVESELSSNQSESDSSSKYCGFDVEVLNSINSINLKLLVELHIAKGQSFGNLLDGKKAANAYHDALKLVRRVPVSKKIEDRSFTFPIFSGLIYLLKFGGVVVETKHESAYEKEIVTNFVLETERHGDAVHYARALAMEADFYSRIDQLEEALVSHAKLEEIYDVGEHSARIVECYGTDRAAQSFAVCARCHDLLGNTEKTIEVINHILWHIIPKMDINNIHNSFILFYPILWIMKDQNMVEQARSTFRKYVLEAFEEKYKREGGSTPCLPFFKPIDILLDLVVNDLSVETTSKYFTWVRDEYNFSCISNGLNNSLSKFGRCADSIFAEIYLLLSTRTDDEEVKMDFITNGIKHARTGLERAQNEDGTIKLANAYKQVRPVYGKLLLQRNSFRDRIT